METMEENWVEEALKHAEAEVTFKDLDALQARRAKLQAKRDQALPIEQDLIDRLDEQIELLDEEIDEELEFRRHLESGADKLDGYKRIHLDIPLSWRQNIDNAKLPVLITYPLDSSTLAFRAAQKLSGDERDTWSMVLILGGVITAFLGLTVGSLSHSLIVGLTSGVLAYLAVNGFHLSRYLYRKHWENGLFPKLPRALARHYDDVFEDNRREATWLSRHVFDRTAHFTGSIPTEVKANIAKAKKTFGDNIYLVAQAEHWDNNDRSEITHVDPLVIGLKGSTTYLIDAFDLVPIEKAVAEEFTE